jgi:integrase
VLGHLFIEEVDTAAKDALKRALPANLGPKSVNNRLALVRAVLRFCWKRGRLAAIPYVPTERAPKKKPAWYSEKERDRFLAGMFELQPQWYLFSKDGTFPRYIDSYKRPMVAVQRARGLRPLSHHALGRHSVASQAVTNGHSIEAVQAQLGHRSEQSTHMYAHLGSHAQLRLVESLQPVAPPHVNVRSTSKKKGT